MTLIPTPEWLYALNGAALFTVGGVAVWALWKLRDLHEYHGSVENDARGWEELAGDRLDTINHLTERNIGLRANNRRLSAELAAFHNARARQIAQCKANAAAGGRARAAKRVEQLKQGA